MFTILACATVALVVMIEQRRHRAGGVHYGSKALRERSQFGMVFPFIALIALGILMDRVPW